MYVYVHVFLSYRRGLRDLADQSNRNVTLWWNTEYSHPTDLTNGVLVTMHDFIASTDMIHFAIERNKRVAAAAGKGAEPRTGLLQFASLTKATNYITRTYW